MLRAWVRVKPEVRAFLQAEAQRAEPEWVPLQEYLATADREE